MTQLDRVSTGCPRIGEGAGRWRAEEALKVERARAYFRIRVVKPSSVTPQKDSALIESCTKVLRCDVNLRAEAFATIAVRDQESLTGASARRELPGNQELLCLGRECGDLARRKESPRIVSMASRGVQQCVRPCSLLCNCCSRSLERKLARCGGEKRKRRG